MSSMRGQTQPQGRHALQTLRRSRDRGRTRTDYDGREIILATALSECLDEMQRNGGDIEAALRRSPYLAPEVRPLLEVASLLLPRKI